MSDHWYQAYGIFPPLFQKASHYCTQEMGSPKDIQGHQRDGTAQFPFTIPHQQTFKSIMDFFPNKNRFSHNQRKSSSSRTKLSRAFLIRRLSILVDTERLVLPQAGGRREAFLGELSKYESWTSSRLFDSSGKPLDPDGKFTPVSLGPKRDALLRGR